MNTETPQYEQDLQAIKEAQRIKALSDIESAQKAATSGFGAEKAAVKPAFQQARRDVSSQSAIGAKNFAEYAANRGLTGSGVSAEANIRRSGALQRDIGALKGQEAGIVSDIARRENLAGQQFGLEQRGAEADIESNYLSNLMNQRNTERQFGQVDRSFEQDVTEFNTQQENIQKEFAFSQVQYDDAVKQRDWQNAFAIKEYQNQLEQQAIDNQFKQQQLNISRYNSTKTQNDDNGTYEVGDTLEDNGVTYTYNQDGQWIPTGNVDSAPTSNTPGNIVTSAKEKLGIQGSWFGLPGDLINAKLNEYKSEQALKEIRREQTGSGGGF